MRVGACWRCRAQAGTCSGPSGRMAQSRRYCRRRLRRARRRLRVAFAEADSVGSCLVVLGRSRLPRRRWRRRGGRCRRAPRRLLVTESPSGPQRRRAGGATRGGAGSAGTMSSGGVGVVAETAVLGGGVGSVGVAVGSEPRWRSAVRPAWRWAERARWQAVNRRCGGVRGLGRAVVPMPVIAAGRSARLRCRWRCAAPQRSARDRWPASPPHCASAPLTTPL